MGILGIGDYKGSMNDLEGVSTDYENIINTFYKKFGYSIVFLNEKNKLLYCNKKPNKKLNQTKFNNNDKFKLRWDEDDIFNFVKEIANILSQEKHDSLLFFISSHGDSDSVLFDSNGEDIPLLFILDAFFGIKLPFMLDKPKIFFLDMCRGPMKSRVKIQTNTCTPTPAKLTSRRAVKAESPVSPVSDVSSPSLAIPASVQDSNNQQTRGNTYTQNISLRSGLNKMREAQNFDDKYNDKKNDDNIDINDRKDNTNEQQGGHNNVFSDARHSRQATSRTSLKDLYHKRANCRYIYANIDGYAAADGGRKGGYLIQSVECVFSKLIKKHGIVNKNLDSIVNHIRLKTRELVGTAIMQNVEDVNDMNFDVYFAKQSHKI